MSFVLSVRGGNFAIMMSDGRVSKSGDKRVAVDETVNDTVYDVMVVERQEQPRKLVMM